MARIAGVNIPTNKRVTIGLRYIYGIGPAKAAEICTRLNIPDARRVNQLSDDEVLRIVAAHHLGEVVRPHRAAEAGVQPQREHGAAG